MNGNLLNFSEFLKESSEEIDNSPFKITEDLVNDLRNNVPELQKLFDLAKISTGFNFFVSDKINGFLVIPGVKPISKLVKDMEGEGFLVFPDWFFDVNTFHIYFIQSEEIKPGAFEIDTWYAINPETFIKEFVTKAWRSSNESEFLIKFNCRSEKELPDCIKSGIGLLIDALKKSRIEIIKKPYKEIDPEMIKALKSEALDFFKEAVDDYFAGGLEKDETYSFSVEDLVIDCFIKDKNLISYFMGFPEDLANKIIESPRIKEIPDSEASKLLKAQAKAKKFMDYL